jgi:hypothetical protein
MLMGARVPTVRALPHSIFTITATFNFHASFEVGSMGREGLRGQGLPEDKNIRSK